MARLHLQFSISIYFNIHFWNNFNVEDWDTYIRFVSAIAHLNVVLTPPWSIFFIAENVDALWSVIMVIYNFDSIFYSFFRSKLPLKLWTNEQWMNRIAFKKQKNKKRFVHVWQLSIHQLNGHYILFPCSNVFGTLNAKQCLHRMHRVQYIHAHCRQRRIENKVKSVQLHLIARLKETR